MTRRAWKIVQWFGMALMLAGVWYLASYTLAAWAANG